MPVNEQLKQALQDPALLEKQGAKEALVDFLAAKGIGAGKDAVYKNRAFWNQFEAFKAPNAILELTPNTDLEDDFLIEANLLELRQLSAEKRILLDLANADTEMLLSLQKEVKFGDWGITRDLLTSEVTTRINQKASNLLLATRVKSHVNVDVLKALAKADSKGDLQPIKDIISNNFQDVQADLITEESIVSLKQAASFRLLELKINALDNTDELEKFIHVGAKVDLERILKKEPYKYSEQQIEGLGALTAQDFIALNILAQAKKALLANPSEEMVAFMLSADFANPASYKEHFKALPRTVNEAHFKEHFAKAKNRASIQKAALLVAVKQKLFNLDNKYGESVLKSLRSREGIKHGLNKIGIKGFNADLEFSGLELKAIEHIVKAHQAIKKLAGLAKPELIQAINRQKFTELPEKDQIALKELAIRQLIRSFGKLDALDAKDSQFLKSLYKAQDTKTFKDKLSSAGISQPIWLDDAKALERMKKEALLILLKFEIKKVSPHMPSHKALIQLLEKLPFKTLQDLLENQLYVIKLLTVINDDRELKKIIPNSDASLRKALIDENEELNKERFSPQEDDVISKNNDENRTKALTDKKETLAETFIKQFLAHIRLNSLAVDEAQLIKDFEESASFADFFKKTTNQEIKKAITPDIFARFKMMQKNEKNSANRAALAGADSDAAEKALDEYKKQHDLFKARYQKLLDIRKYMDKQIIRITNMGEGDVAKLALASNASELIEKLQELDNLNSEFLDFVRDYDAILDEQLEGLPADNHRVAERVHKNKYAQHREDILGFRKRLNESIERHQLFHDKLHGLETEESPYLQKGLLGTLKDANKRMFMLNTTYKFIRLEEQADYMKAPNQVGAPVDEVSLEANADLEDEDDGNDFRLVEPIPAGFARLHTFTYEIAENKEAKFSMIEERKKDKNITENGVTTKQPNIKITLCTFPSAQEGLRGDESLNAAKAYYAATAATKMLSAMSGFPTEANPIVIKGGAQGKEKVAFLYAALRYLGVDAKAIAIRGKSGFVPSTQEGWFWGTKKESYHDKYFKENGATKHMADAIAAIKGISTEAKDLGKGFKQASKGYSNFREELAGYRKNAETDNPEPPSLKS